MAARLVSLRSAFLLGRLACAFCFSFAVPFANLLFDLFGDQIDGGIEIAFGIFGKEIGTADAEPHRAFELFFGGFGLVVFEIHAGVHGPAVKVFQFLDASQDVVFDGFGQFDVMRRKHEFHIAQSCRGHSTKSSEECRFFAAPYVQ